MKNQTQIDKMRERAEKSRKVAIRLFCLECVGYSEADVTRCTAPNCPLYKWRKGRVLDEVGDEVDGGETST